MIHHDNTVRKAAKDRRTHRFRSSYFPTTRNICSSGSGSQIVAMMRAAEFGHGCNLAPCTRIFFRLATGRRFLRLPKMSPVRVIIPDVLIRKSYQCKTYSTEAEKTRSICALFIGLRLLFMVLGVIR